MPSEEGRECCTDSMIRTGASRAMNGHHGRVVLEPIYNFQFCRSGQLLINHLIIGKPRVDSTFNRTSLWNPIPKALVQLSKLTIAFGSSFDDGTRVPSMLSDEDDTHTNGKMHSFHI